MKLQVWFLGDCGRLIHAGPREIDTERLGPSMVRRWVREWEQWADGIAKQWPDCPTANSRRQVKTVYIDLPDATTSQHHAKTGRYICSL